MREVYPPQILKVVHCDHNLFVVSVVVNPYGLCPNLRMGVTKAEEELAFS